MEQEKPQLSYIHFFQLLLASYKSGQKLYAWLELVSILQIFRVVMGKSTNVKNINKEERKKMMAI